MTPANGRHHTLLIHNQSNAKRPSDTRPILALEYGHHLDVIPCFVAVANNSRPFYAMTTRYGQLPDVFNSAFTNGSTSSIATLKSWFMSAQSQPVGTNPGAPPEEIMHSTNALTS